MPDLLDHTIDPADIRTALQEIDPDALPDSTIASALEDVELIVYSRLPDDWESDDDITMDHIDHVIKHEAKRKAFNSAPMEARVQALDAVVSMDVQSFRGQLNRDAEQAWELIGLSTDGTSSPFVDATGHAPGGGTRRRNRRWQDYHRG